MSEIITFLVAIMLLGSTAAACPMYRCDPAGTNYATMSVPEQVHLLYQYNDDVGQGGCQSNVAGFVVCINATHIEAYEPAKGVLWSVLAANATNPIIDFNNDSIVLSQTSAFELTSDGEFVWTSNLLPDLPGAYPLSITGTGKVCISNHQFLDVIYTNGLPYSSINVVTKYNFQLLGPACTFSFMAYFFGESAAGERALLAFNTEGSVAERVYLSWNYTFIPVPEDRAVQRLRNSPVFANYGVLFLSYESSRDAIFLNFLRDNEDHGSNIFSTQLPNGTINDLSVDLTFPSTPSAWISYSNSPLLIKIDLNSGFINATIDLSLILPKPLIGLVPRSSVIVSPYQSDSVLLFAAASSLNQTSSTPAAPVLLAVKTISHDLLWSYSPLPFAPSYLRNIDMDALPGQIAIISTVNASSTIIAVPTVTNLLFIGFSGL